MEPDLDSELVVVCETLSEDDADKVHDELLSRVALLDDDTVWLSLEVREYEWDADAVIVLDPEAERVSEVDTDVLAVADGENVVLDETVSDAE